MVSLVLLLKDKNWGNWIKDKKILRERCFKFGLKNMCVIIIELIGIN